MGARPGGQRRRGAGAVLLPLVLRRRPAPGPGGGPAGGLRRVDARPGQRRQPALPVRLLGAHHRLLVPAGRAQPAARRQPRCRADRPAGDELRRPGNARRAADAGRGRAQLLVGRRGGGGTAGGRRGRCRGAGAARRPHQVRPGAVPLLAARGDGGAHPGLRLPPLGGHGEGRRLPAGGAGARFRRGAGMAPDRDDGRRRDDGAGRLPGAAPARHQAPAGVRHGLPARLPRRAARLGHQSRCRRRAGDAGGPRRVQVHPVPHRRHHRPLDRHPRPA
ncbi:hypothetical protein SDC9_133841 [bioreactor metagenome]|uniref:Uncharacterized protein n=1 Tax=bioreactor metagenome TaxID=1076179 RepID=A0A645DBC2_9ZZZZ